MKTDDRVIVMGPTGTAQYGQRGTVLAIRSAGELWPERLHRPARRRPRVKFDQNEAIVEVKMDDGRTRNFRLSNLRVEPPTC